MYHSLALCKQPFFRTNEGSLLPSDILSIITCVCPCQHQLHQLAATNCPNIVSTNLRWVPIATLQSVSKLRLSSQLIPLHPKVIHNSLVLFPWKSFFWTDDSPLKPKLNVYNTIDYVFLGGH